MELHQTFVDHSLQWRWGVHSDTLGWGCPDYPFGGGGRRDTPDYSVPQEHRTLRWQQIASCHQPHSYSLAVRKLSRYLSKCTLACWPKLIYASPRRAADPEPRDCTVQGGWRPTRVPAGSAHPHNLSYSKSLRKKCTSPKRPERGDGFASSFLLATTNSSRHLQRRVMDFHTKQTGAILFCVRLIC